MTELFDDDIQLYIDQLGRVVRRQTVRPNWWGNVRRCRECIYYSRVGQMLPAGVYHQKHCKYERKGPADEYKDCETSVWMEVKADEK